MTGVEAPGISHDDVSGPDGDINFIGIGLELG